jgi:hypothetical protein
VWLTSRRRTLYILLIVCAATRAFAGTGKLLSYRCAVKKLNWKTATVTSTFETAGDAGSMVIYLRIDDHQRLSALQVEDTVGHSVIERSTSTPSGLEIHAQSGGSHTWHVAYTASASEGSLYKVPLPVPSVPPVPGTAAVRLELSIPSGEELYGDLFPEMNSDKSKGFVAELSSVSAFLIFHSGDAGGVSWKNRVFATAYIADFCMVIVVIAGTLLLLMRRTRSNKA